jgi:5'-methylthioadenosine phosphorylase
MIGGSGVYEIPGIETNEEIVDTQYGQAKVYLGLGKNEDLIFIPRHGIDHSIPPHKVNYRANITAFKKLGVERVFGTYAVGSLKTSIPPGGFVLLDQFIDLNFQRTATFFQGEDFGLGHTDMTEPYCTTLRDALYEQAVDQGFPLLPNGTYVCFNGPRFETAAEIRMFAQWGGDVIGMTGGTEASLAREAGLHFAGVAFSINYAAGLKHSLITIEKPGFEQNILKLTSLIIAVFRGSFEPVCPCANAVHMSEPPKINLFE